MTNKRNGVNLMEIMLDEMGFTKITLVGKIFGGRAYKAYDQFSNSEVTIRVYDNGSSFVDYE